MSSENLATTRTIVVTGATGTVGGEVVRLLSETDVRVRAACRSPARASPRLEPLGAEVMEFDYGRADTFATLLRGAHSALVLAPDSPEHADQIKGFIAAALEHGIRYVVTISGLQTAPEVSLARWNRDAEEVVKRSGIRSTTLRPNSFMQNFSRFADGIRRDNVIALPFGQGRVSWVDGRDVAAVAAALLTEETHVGETLDLTGPAAMTTSEVAIAFSEALRRPITYADVPAEAASQGMAAMGLPPWAVTATTELFAACREGRMATVSSAVADVTRRSPRTLERFIHDNVRAFSKHDDEA